MKISSMVLKKTIIENILYFRNLSLFLEKCMFLLLHQAINISENSAIVFCSFDKSFIKQLNFTMTSYNLSWAKQMPLLTVSRTWSRFSRFTQCIWHHGQRTWFCESLAEILSRFLFSLEKMPLPVSYRCVQKIHDALNQWF